MLKTVKLSFVLALVGMLGFVRGASADVRLPKVFASHMVLQQDKPLVFWGWANPGEAVSVTIGANTAKTTATDKGEWKLALPPMHAGGPAVTVTVTGSNTITLDDVLIGEVWLCSGQSNMEFGIGMAANAKEAIAAANQPDIRLLMVPNNWKPLPQDDMDGEWKVCTPTSVAAGGWNGFSAVGYFFGLELHKALGVPVGLIDADWGGTRIESWTCPKGFAQVPALKADYERLQLGIPGNPEHDRRLGEALDAIDAWSTTARKSITDQTLPGPMPTLPAELLGPNDVQNATALFNGMIHPICPFPIRGVIWYQGESNHDEGMLYTQRMKALIAGWRDIWGEGSFPFYYVQIAPFNYGDQRPYLPEFWEAQAAAEAIPNTGMIVINDIGNLDNIHPTNKIAVGHRLAVRALEDTYGKKDVIGHSPEFKSLAADGATLKVTFDHTGTGLASRDGKPISWFEIAGPDSNGYHKADAKIDGSTVQLTAPDVKNPTAVRFAWAMLAVPNLMNSAGLPASAFRAGSVPVVDQIAKNVPELKGYKLVYDLDLSKLGPEIHYTTDNHAAIDGPFDRIAYAVQLNDADGHSKWVYVSMDAFTTDAAKIGVPTVGSGEMFQENLSHLNVFSNVHGIVTGEYLTGGNIEFWPNNYAAPNSANIPNASSQTFDFGDQPTDPVDGYGSMQIHNHDAKQTLFAINDWREGQQADIGIGNAPTGNPDWTFAKNADNCTTMRLRIFVHPK